METTKIKQDQFPRNLEWTSRYDGRIYPKRKVKLSPVQNFLFWSAIVITIGIISTRLALLMALSGM